MVRKRQLISKNGVLRLLDEIDAEGAGTTVCVSAEALANREFSHLLPEDERKLRRVEVGLEAAANSDTGVVLFISNDRTVAIQPPIPMSLDICANGAHTEPMRELLSSDPTIGVVLLRLERYAVCVLRGERLLATKTDSRYMKNRHRAGGQSQRRFQRSRERLIRELYDKTCEVTQDVFGPFLAEIDHVMLGGEQYTLNGFVKRCRLLRDLGPSALSRRLAVDRPNQKALQSISYEMWKSWVTFL